MKDLEHRRARRAARRASTPATATATAGSSRRIRRLLQALDQDLSEDECLLAFEMTDADGDGTISFEEFMGWWTGE